MIKTIWEESMKKLIKLIVLVLTLLTLTACNTGVKETANTEAPANTEGSAEGEQEIKIYLTRHGKTILNTSDLAQGWIDAPLTQPGIDVAESLGKGLSDIKFDAVYSSDSGRSIETAKIVLQHNGQPELFTNLIQDQRLREFCFGMYEGMSNTEMATLVAEKQNLTYAEWVANISVLGYVNNNRKFANDLAELDKAINTGNKTWPAEDYQTVTDRTRAAMDEIVATAQEKGETNILVVSHGMALAALLTDLNGADVEAGSGLKNASISLIIYKDGQYKVESVNDMSYVEAGAAIMNEEEEATASD